MEFNNKYEARYSTFEFIPDQKAVNVLKERIQPADSPQSNASQGDIQPSNVSQEDAQPSNVSAQPNNVNGAQADAPKQPRKYIWSNRWIDAHLSSVLLQFLMQWHGSEIIQMCCYVDKSSFIISGAVEFSEELKHQIKSENVIIGGCSFQFNPLNCNPLDHLPLDVWRAENADQEIIEYPRFEGYRTDRLGGRDEYMNQEVSIGLVQIVEKVMPVVKLLVGSDVMPVINAIKDLGLEISKAMEQKKKKRLMVKIVIFKLGMKMFEIFGKTCNILIHKYTASHNFTADLYGVLYEKFFFIDPSTPFKIFVFREGSMSVPKQCRKEHHWFAYGRDNTFKLATCWENFLSSSKPFSFQRQGRILSQDLLEEAREKATEYLNSVFKCNEEAENPEKPVVQKPVFKPREEVENVENLEDAEILLPNPEEEPRIHKAATL